MAEIPAGKYLRGSKVTDLEERESEKPQQEVVINHAFGMGVHPVTRGEFMKYYKAISTKSFAFN
jgi:formylglycine-generating enzyme required for sulfatase activity